MYTIITLLSINSYELHDSPLKFLFMIVLWKIAITSMESHATVPLNVNFMIVFSDVFNYILNGWLNLNYHQLLQSRILDFRS